ncbi:hypothetical protein DVH05_010756 [Phytophthora capsici]|nr:hypothetical protein DVH05_010756 [Phytophthora capsici]
MDSFHLAKTVLNVLLYSLVELASFIALTQTLKKRLNFSTIHQLVFVLDRYMIHVQTAIILWVFYTTQISLEHFGSYNCGHYYYQLLETYKLVVLPGTDYSFEFAWLRGISTQ